jgi:chemotaxis protein methyltransferase CheR
MTPDDFTFLARVLRRRSGLSLGLEKMGLVERRLAPVMRRFGFKDMNGLIGELRHGREALAEAVTQAMTVNETSFFRDPALFRRFRELILPRLMAVRSQEKRLRIWSAGCATGQEAYAIAIILSELGLAQAGWSIDLIATDLSGEAIHRAEAGRYAACEVQRGLDAQTINHHFRSSGSGWVADEALRRMVTFRRFNLLDSFGWLDDLDIVFCRNVLMYFALPERLSVLERIADTLAGDGVLLLGENEMPQTPAFMPSPDGPGIYMKVRTAVARAG